MSIKRKTKALFTVNVHAEAPSAQAWLPIAEVALRRLGHHSSFLRCVLLARSSQQEDYHPKE